MCPPTAEKYIPKEVSCQHNSNTNPVFFSLLILHATETAAKEGDSGSQHYFP